MFVTSSFCVPGWQQQGAEAGSGTMGENKPGRESINIRRFPGVSGIEVLEAINSPRHWRSLNTAFGMAVPMTWHGEARYRGRQRAVKPGQVHCVEPGEIHAVPRIQHPGTFYAFIIDHEVFGSYLAEHGVPRGRAEWARTVQDPSPTVISRIVDVLRLPGSIPTQLEAQSRLVRMFESLARELIVTTGSNPPKAPSPSRISQVRECLHEEDSSSLDLETLARRFGMSRFQVLRSFQARYGLPPHAYQLCVRVARARKLLKDGSRVAEVSALCGFADQSHFGRHFKQHTGLTPTQYVSMTTSARVSMDPDTRANSDVSAI
jgi:AraC-like DNA-binding protein